MGLTTFWRGEYMIRATWPGEWGETQDRETGREQVSEPPSAGCWGQLAEVGGTPTGEARLEPGDGVNRERRSSASWPDRV